MSKGKRIGGATRIDPGTKQWLDQGASNPAALTSKQKRDRARSRAKYDLDEVVVDAVKVAAGRVSTSYSQLAEFLLAYALVQWLDGEELWDSVHNAKKRTSAVRFDWDLELPDAVIETLERFVNQRDS